MYSAITPTLSSTVGYVDDIRDQISALIVFIIKNPGSTSSLWEVRMISFRKLSAQFEHDREVFVSKLQAMTDRAIRSMFPDYTFSLEFKAYDYVEGVDDGRYTVKFSVFVEGLNPDDITEQVSALVSGNIIADPLTNDVKVKFAHTLDNATIQTK